MNSLRQTMEQLQRPPNEDISTSTVYTSTPEARQISSTSETLREGLIEQETLTSNTLQYLQQIALLNSEPQNNERQEQDLEIEKSNLTLQTAHTLLSLLAIIRSNVVAAASSSQPIQSPTQTSSQHEFALFTSKPPLLLMRPSDTQSVCEDGSTANLIALSSHMDHNHVMIPGFDQGIAWSGMKHEKNVFCIKCGMFHAGVQENEALAVQTIYHYAFAKRRKRCIYLLIMVFVTVQLYFFWAHMRPNSSH